MTAVMRAVAQQTRPEGSPHRPRPGRSRHRRAHHQAAHDASPSGRAKRAMFVVPTPNIPPQFKLFELDRQRLLPELPRRHDRPRRARDGHQRSRGAPRPGEARRPGVPGSLTEEARGKVVIGDTTFLFQFVAPPPPQPRPQLPLVRQRRPRLARSTGRSRSSPRSASCSTSASSARCTRTGSIPSSAKRTSPGLIDMTKNLPAPPPVEEKNDQPTDTTSNNRQGRREEGRHEPEVEPGARKDQRSESRGARARSASDADADARGVRRNDRRPRRAQPKRRSRRRLERRSRNPRRASRTPAAISTSRRRRRDDSRRSAAASTNSVKPVVAVAVSRSDARSEGPDRSTRPSARSPRQRRSQTPRPPSRGSVPASALATTRVSRTTHRWPARSSSRSRSRRTAT